MSVDENLDPNVVQMPGRNPDIARGLDAECSRMALLLHIVQRHRDGKQISGELKRDLAAAQAQVDTVRKNGLWRVLLEKEPAIDCDAPLVADVLASALYAHLRPSASFAMLALQPGTSEPVFTQALLHELLMLRPHEEGALQALLSPVAPLVASHLLRIDGIGPVRRIHAGAKLLRLALGQEDFGNLPNGVRLLDVANQPIDDLLLSDKTQARLEEAIALADYFERETLSGRPVPGGPNVLFYGAPGTGKSLAARHVARRLNRPLFQLDLGGIVSKWVGETERNLSRVFEQMSGTNGCILIDEADAILGKRVSVKEGRDNYVNITVSHLLSLLENHCGMVMLTSNLRANLDDAYIRRFSAVVEFVRPDAVLRQTLWGNALSGCVTAVDRKEIAALAADIDLSAAEIRNAGHLAIALAQARGGIVDCSHVGLAIWRERTKTTLTFTREDLRQLAPFVEGML